MAKSKVSARAVAKARSIGRAVDEIENSRSYGVRGGALHNSSLIPDAMPSVIATGLSTGIWPVSDVLRGPVDLLEVEDRRSFNPDPDVPARSSRIWRSRLAVPTASRLAGRTASQPVYGVGSIAFKAPAKVAICVRRKVRKQVLLAKGKGGGSHRKPRRNRYSNVWC